MITILHGENIVQSRKRLSEILEIAKKAGQERVSLDGKKISLSEARSALESASLFGVTKLVVLENFFSSPKSKEKENILDYLDKGKFDNDLIIWEGKEIKGEILERAEREVFKVSSLIFKFLESLRPGNARESLLILAEIKREEEPEMIFYMLVRQFRHLLIASDLGVNGLREFPSWQQRKLLGQTPKFNLNRLREIYQKLLEIDYASKTSGDVFPLSSRLDLLVSEI